MSKLDLYERRKVCGHSHKQSFIWNNKSFGLVVSEKIFKVSVHQKKRFPMAVMFTCWIKKKWGYFVENLTYIICTNYQIFWTWKVQRRRYLNKTETRIAHGGGGGGVFSCQNKRKGGIFVPTTKSLDLYFQRRRF